MFFFARTTFRRLQLSLELNVFDTQDILFEKESDKLPLNFYAVLTTDKIVQHVQPQASKTLCINPLRHKKGRERERERKVQGQ